MKISIKTPQDFFPSFKGSFRGCPCLRNQVFSNCILLLGPAISFPFPIINKEIEQVISGTRVEPCIYSKNLTKAPLSSTSQKLLSLGAQREAPQLPTGSVEDWPFFPRTP